MSNVANVNNVDLSSILLKDNVQRSFEKPVLELIYKTAKAQGIPDSDFVKFIHKAQMTGANPTLDQIYLLPYKSNGRVTGQILFHYSFLETVAMNIKEYNGMTRKTGVGEYFDPETMEAKKMLFCEATVKRNEAEYSYTAWFCEYAQRKYDGTLTRQWKSSPYMMLEKCALAGALRRAFPEALSGVYSEDEQGFLKNENDEKIEREVIIGEKVEKYEEIKERIAINDEKIENKEEFDSSILKIKEIMTFLCDGYSKDQKTRAMKQYLKVDSFSDLSKKSMDEVREILNTVAEIAGKKV